MEYIDGITLEELVERCGPLPAARVSHFLKQACDAIVEAHGVGLVHRDIKPANIMICHRGGIPDFLKVMDFGLVKELGTEPSQPERTDISLAAAPTVVGTPLYLAPEAISRPGEVDARADIYALGAVAYYMLVGEPVFAGRTIVEVLGHQLHSIPVAPSERTSNDIPPSLERMVLRCLEKDPSHRFPTVVVLRSELQLATDIAEWGIDAANQWWTTQGEAMVLDLRSKRA